MSTDLSVANWIDLFRAFIGDEEDESYNVTSLKAHLRLGAIEKGYAILDPTKPSINETIAPFTIDGMILTAYCARSLLKPRKSMKSFSAGSPRRSFTFENVQGALQRAQAFICVHDSSFKMPSDYQNEIYTIFNAAQIGQDTVEEVVGG